MTLFGRDSLISALEMLAYMPEMAGETLRLLAFFQGTSRDNWRDEEPGKMMHELRVGEMARLGEIPQTPCLVFQRDDAQQLRIVDSAVTGQFEIRTADD